MLVAQICGVNYNNYYIRFQVSNVYAKDKHFLVVLQMLLSNPVIEDAVNPNAAQIFASSPTSFRQMVLDCVLASKRVEGKIIIIIVLQSILNHKFYGCL